MTGTLGFVAGVPVLLSPYIEDGSTLILRTAAAGGARTLVIGTHRRSSTHTEALRIVREGLADVLRWLGEPVEVPTHETVLARLRGVA